MASLALFASALVCSSTSSGFAVIPMGSIDVTASASVAPIRLPRSTEKPVTLGLGFTSARASSAETPELSSMALKISRNVEFQTAGLPSCPILRLFSYHGNPRRTCAGSLVGHGSVVSEVTLPGKPPATVHGHLLAFYNEEELSSRSVPHILAQVRTGGEEPLIYRTSVCDP